ncbi:MULTISPECIES: hypothetical protein [Bacillus]|uniref:Uncharacterized protein n=1 Tax=Bacillus glycinifermentans TaxID=1664069 RepID=A0ABU6HA08_9BACI|nr:MULTISPECIES: hypothetical protein [Bacillus]MBU8787097.1 hypothetical protein [Bacillus glycinifermentans]MDU0070078.1 hypothetical protein [Bacillus sp. IG6]MEC0487798.1 hypothetical protein [Bacillus glycinifermentans]MED8017751.1 hypothetical protein [Bacillus glycinifermentans]WKB76136.1 hypothetical protein QYM22_17245 [Bacillus glycinifermentans]
MAKEKKKKQTILKVGKEVYGTMDREECFRKALEPYFTTDKELKLNA